MGRDIGRVPNSWTQMEKRLNDAVSESKVGKYFKLEARKSCFTTELRAGTATFLTMAYIITVNASILADSGATCSASDCTPPPNSMVASPGCTLTPNAGYQSCLQKVKNDLIVATAWVSMIGSLAMGLLANLPLGLAPGMGANAFLAYDMVGFHGSGPIPYRTALAVVLLEGTAFLLIAGLGLRGRLARLIPHPVRLACAAGIGLFIAFVGLQRQQGVGLVGRDASTLVAVAACSGSTDATTGACTGHKLRSPTFWLGFSGFLVMCYGLMKNVKGSMVLGILLVTFVSWFRGTSVTAFPYTPQGDSSFRYFKKVVDFHPILRSTAGQISFAGFNKSEVWVALVTLLYVEVLATTGTLYTMAEIGEFVNEDGDGFEGEYAAYMVDAGSTVVGSALGVSPISTFVESSVGIREGGRTGLTAVVVAAYMFLSLFFVPLLASVPPWAIGPSLVLVGVFMMKVVRDIEWDNVKAAVPAFVTIALMPLTYSISNGVVAGVGLYAALSLYDVVLGRIRWTMELRSRMVRERNQVSATGVEIMSQSGA